jgi:transcriptional regulator with XRE-family HTH domain
MTFAEKLKELRQERGMTQEGLAKASNIPVGTIRDYEQGKRDPLLSNAQRLAHALDISLDVFPTPADIRNASGHRHKALTATPRAGEPEAVGKQARQRKGN